jgi:MOSC domain-containing protein YiiM
MGNVIGIAKREKTRAPMKVSSSAKISFENGVGDDSRGLIKGNRQVTVMTQESWADVCGELDCNLEWTTRRANLLIDGIDLENTKGDILKIGNFMLEITGELVPCNRMDEQLNGLTKALVPNWRGGVTCKVLSEGDVKEGDIVTLSERI